MKRLEGVALIAGIGMALMAAQPASAQAYSVGSNGDMSQEKPDSVLAIPQADQASKEQLLKLFAVMRIREQVQTLRTNVSQMVESQLREQIQEIGGTSGNSKLTPEQRKAVENLINRYIEKAVDVYPVDEMIGDMTTVYQHHLTREDVDGMIAFYSSPAGQHLLEAQPKIAREYMPLVTQRAEERTKLLRAEMMKDLAEMKESFNSNSGPAKQ